MSKNLTAALVSIIAIEGDETIKTSALEAIAQSFEDRSFETFVAKVLTQDENAPVEQTGEAAPVVHDVDAPVTSAEVRYRDLEDDEEIEAGDEWKLKDGFRHNGGKQVMWRTVDVSIGDLVEDHAKSQFRRRI